MLALAVATLLFAFTSGWLLYSHSRPPRPGAETVTRFDVQPADAESALTLVFRPAVALSSNGSTLAFVAATGGVNRVYVRSRDDTIPRLITGSEGGTGPALSPDGKWVAFFADGKIKKAPVDGEASMICVLALTGGGARWQVTSAGGLEPHWSEDGRQLFYSSANRLMAVPIEPGETFRRGKARPLFDGIYNWGIESGRTYDRDPNAARFLLVRPVEAAGSQRTVRIVLNWSRDIENATPR